MKVEAEAVPVQERKNSQREVILMHTVSLAGTSCAQTTTVQIAQKQKTIQDIRRKQRGPTQWEVV